MTLADILRQLDQFSISDTATIYAQRPWSPDALAFVSEQPVDGKLPESAASDGFSYFLEVFIAQDFLAEWPDSFDAFCSRIIRYAEHDA